MYVILRVMKLQELPVMRIKRYFEGSDPENVLQENLLRASKLQPKDKDIEKELGRLNKIIKVQDLLFLTKLFLCRLSS